MQAQKDTHSTIAFKIIIANAHLSLLIDHSKSFGGSYSLGTIKMENLDIGKVNYLRNYFNLNNHIILSLLSLFLPVSTGINKVFS
jgi:hypothetical protein